MRRREFITLLGGTGGLWRRQPTEGRPLRCGADQTAEPFAKGLAGVCGRPWSDRYFRVGAVLRLACWSRRFGHPLAARTNPKGLAMASKRPSFQAEMLEVLSLCALHECLCRMAIRAANCVSNATMWNLFLCELRFCSSVTFEPPRVRKARRARRVTAG
jgi:hypothetical protein